MSSRFARPQPAKDEVLEILLDRRHFARGLILAEATCHIHGDSFIGTARNLSEGGLFIETRWKPESGNEIDVELAFRAYPLVLRLRGEVTRVERDGVPGLGIHLKGLDEAARAELRNWFSLED